MILRLSARHASELGLPDSSLYVKAATFLGMPCTYMVARASDPGYVDERFDTVDTALRLGFDVEKSVVIIINKEPKR